MTAPSARRPGPTIVGTSYLRRLRNNLRRHALTQPTRKTLPIFRGRNLTELGLWISSGAALGGRDVLDPARNGVVPVGHRGSAPDRCAVPRLGHVEGLMEHLQDRPTASEITAPTRAPPRQQAVPALDRICRPDRGDAHATGR